MKLVTFDSGTGPLLGALAADGSICDLAAAHRARFGGNSPVYASMQNLIEAGPPALDLARELVESMPAAAHIEISPGKAQPHLLAPLPVPMQLRDFMGFETHVRQAGHSVMRLQAKARGDTEALAEIERAGPPKPMDAWFRQPLYYKCNRFAMAGTDTDLHWPAYSSLMDFELELAVVIGRQGRDIPKAEAGKYIFGYTIYNDFSARDAQAAEMGGPLGPAKGKDFDGANVMGPCIVTADEIGDPYNLPMRARVNGETWTDGNSGSIHWTFEDMIAHVSRGETLYPGEIFGSGTVGNGCGLEHMRFLDHGDLVELEIPPIGVLRNRVLAPHLPKSEKKL
ncbi:fumarylacetoacetate hydrolase family protein [Microbulbifer rhizosphaerae]|uniref:2-keto-4-pentenoate hydratase/2-oxohepta-3-ene-1,7-dioic acid hydratase in catechol pathway n=1 Tax=Microbulbifer rhizosphaerae TaxID=1562603 RepID=A0A7W4Z920_9GAMM|nr:fumarylacetoacetate hydrolase family protein [Microbulbifer rhizosphaerae]MBB3059819.1 2-keto-4-pentenoate hydratase/2-oxohepta-3-ene-1,7-dioic acid hydratase in catechol pathway [Microbulbifer rhizosphaerae]